MRTFTRIHNLICSCTATPRSLRDTSNFDGLELLLALSVYAILFPGFLLRPVSHFKVFMNQCKIKLLHSLTIILVINFGLNPAVAAQKNPAKKEPLQRLHLELHGVRLAGDQSQDTSGVNPGVVTLEKNIVLDDDGRFSEINVSNFPGKIQFRSLSVGSKDGVATVDLLKWRAGTEILRTKGQQAATTYANLLLLTPQKALTQASQPKQLDSTSTNIVVKQSMLDAAGRSMIIVSNANGGDVTSIQLGPLLYEYSDYRAVQTQRQPKHIRVTNNGKFLAEWSTEAKLSDGKDQSVFDIPDGYGEAKVDTQLRATLIAPNTYRIDGTESGYHTAFSVGTHSVAVYDAPSSTKEVAAVKALIEQTVPGKKIAYVVISHTHNDHIAGLPIYLGTDLKNVLVGKKGSLSIQRQWGTNVANITREISATTELDLGGKIIQLFPVASSHASDMLVAYDADNHILFQGDMFQLSENGPVTPAFDAIEDLQELIEREKLSPKMILSVHGRIANGNDFEMSIALRKAKLSRRD
jgi:glyoxylase-like metal-dependent hydrolase (beta-lactamase superfamily II)